MRRHNDSGNLSFDAVMRRHNDSGNLTDSQIFGFTNSHLAEVVACKEGGNNVTQLKLLYQKHYTFINTGFDYLRGKIGNVSNSPFLPTYGVLLDCLKVFIPILNRKSTFVLYDKWEEFIRFYLHSHDFSSARGQIRLFMESLCLGIKYTASRIPPRDMIHDKCKPIIVLELLMAYVKCLCESDRVDVSALSEVVDELDPWLIEFDKDTKRRRWLVESVIKKIQFDDSEQFVQLFGLILVEHKKVCNNEAMIESGVKLVLKKQRPFILKVLRYLASKLPVEAMNESAIELDACMMQCKQAFIRDIDRALMLWSNNEFVDKNKRILQYTTNLLHFVFDVLITAHNENSHELLERILCLFETRRSVGMLWQFKSHHNHLGSERFHNQLESGKIQLSWGNDEFLIKEGDSTEDLERIASDIRKKVPWSLESGCLLAHILYDLGERMLLMGDINKALKYAREGCVLRHRLIQNSSRLPPNNQSQERVHAFLMYHIVAARAW
ncbi:hypothetical protein Tco_1095374 [Tanacetum coccineum]